MATLEQVKKRVEELMQDPGAKRACSWGAREVLESFGGMELEFAKYANPEQTLLSKEETAQGHHFNLVTVDDDEEPVLVDVWAGAALGKKAIYRLGVVAEATEVLRLYGSPSFWRFTRWEGRKHV